MSSRPAPRVEQRFRYPWFAAGITLVRCGVGLLNGLTAKAVQAAVPEEHAGVASGIAATARSPGILVGITDLGAVLFDQTRELFLPTALVQGISPHVAERPSRDVVADELVGFRVGLPPGAAATNMKKISMQMRAASRPP